MMADRMTLPATFDEFAAEYKMVDSKEIYSNGIEYIPIFRVKQWLEEHHAAGCCGEWKRQKQGFYFVCSVCGKASATKGNYCHACGAKMDKENAE